MPDLEIAHLAFRYESLRILDPGRIRRLAASLLQEGQHSPVLVVDNAVLVDGYHRVAALRALGRDLVTAVDLEVEAPDALLLAWRMETGRRKSALEEAWLLTELIEGAARPAGTLAREMGRSKSWVTERLGLVRVLPTNVQEAVRQARLPAHSAMKSLLPMARADHAACEALVNALEGALSGRQIERLYAAWRKADAEGKQRIVAQPMLFLKTEAALSPVPLDAEERLASAFETIAGLCRKARRQTRRGEFPRGNGVAGRSWEQALQAFKSLELEIQRARS